MRSAAAPGIDLDPPHAFHELSLGTRETSEAGFLSLLMFVPKYLQRLIEIGEADAEKKMDELTRVVMGAAVTPSV